MANELIEIEQMGEVSTIERLQRADMDTQISTAKKYPRSLTAFRQMGLAMVTQDEDVARESIYVLPARRGSSKSIEGPSVRFAEMVQSAWGNCRSGARVVHEGREFLTAQGVFHDLETNSAVTFEVQRRIVDSKGNRYGVDMIGVTANAACSVALRNAILKGVPKAMWSNLMTAAKKTIAGDSATFMKRCQIAIEKFESIGVKRVALFEYLGIKGGSDLTVDHLIDLGGMLTAIEDGELQPATINRAAKAPAPTESPRTTPPPLPPTTEPLQDELPPTEEPDLPKEEPDPPPAKAAKAPKPPKPPKSKTATAKKPTVAKGIEPDAPVAPVAPVAPDAPEDQSPPSLPGDEGFDLSAYIEDVRSAMSAARDRDLLNEVFIQVEAELFPHVPASVQGVIGNEYQNNVKRLEAA